MYTRVPLIWFLVALAMVAAIECRSNSLKKPRNSRRQNEDEHTAPVFTRISLPMKLLQQDEVLHLRCKVNGNPKPRIKWLYNGQDLSDPPEQFDQRIEIGQFSLLVKRLEVADSGNYTCVAGNILGLIEHNSQVVVIPRPLPKTPPIIMSNSQNCTVKMGEDISLQCKVMDMSSSTLHIEWVKHIKVNESWMDPVNERYHMTLVLDGSEAKNP